MDSLMNWVTGFFIGLSFILFIWLSLSLVANRRTSKKRHQLINRWTTSGDPKLAAREYGEVDYVTHYKACRWLQNPKKLYGPLIQGVWDDDQPKVYDPFWWRCYNEIYLKLDPHAQSRIKYVMVKSNVHMPTAMAMCHMDLDAWLSQSPPPANKLTMSDGADEYDQIMAMQDLING